MALALVACISATTTSLPTVEVAPTSTTQPTSTIEPELQLAILPSVTPHTFEPTPEVWPTLPPDSRTGISMVDAVIEAVLSSDPDKVLSLIHYTTSGCTHASGLGGPPKCKEGEPEGTLVESFPTLGPEGVNVRPEEMQFSFPPDGYGLFAVYEVVEGGFTADYWPAGKYGVVFVTEPPDWSYTALVDETGIVRAVYSHSIESALDQSVGEFILPPVQMPDLTPVIPEGQTWVQLNEPDVILAFPNTITLVKNAEANRRGSFASYDFQYQTETGTPRFQEIQFFSAESIQAFTDACEGSSAPCFFGDYPDIERYNAQRAAFESGVELEGFSRWRMYHRGYFVRNLPCEGDTCVIREYTTFQDSVKIDIWVMMASAEEAGQADEMFSNLRILPEPGFSPPLTPSP